MDLLFEVISNLGKRIRISRAYWDVISTKKHPSVRNMENEVKLALTEPFEVRKSRQDATVFLYYRKLNGKFICVVAKHLKFIITAVSDGKDKEGRDNMEKTFLRIFYFRETDSVDIWFDEPEKEEICEEIDDAILLKKDKEGNVIGVEIISMEGIAKKGVEIPL